MNKEVIVELMQDFGNIEVPDYERYFKISSNKRIIDKTVDIFRGVLQDTLNTLGADSINVADTSTYKVVSLFISGYGWLTFNEIGSDSILFEVEKR